MIGVWVDEYYSKSEIQNISKIVQIYPIHAIPTRIYISSLLHKAPVWRSVFVMFRHLFAAGLASPTWAVATVIAGFILRGIILLVPQNKDFRLLCEIC